MKWQALFLIALALPLASAFGIDNSNYGTFKQNDCIRLLQVCSNCTYINITSVNYPNSTQTLGQSNMTKTGTEYDYSFCKTSELGTYNVYGFGDEGGTDAVWAYDFLITSDGNEPIQEGQSSVLWIPIISILALALTFFFIGYSFNSNAFKLVFYGLGIVFMFILSLYSLVIVNTAISNYTILVNGYADFWLIVKIIASLLITASLVVTLWVVYIAWMKKRGRYNED